MHVTRLWLKDFRSYPEADVLLQPGVTALVGRNGQGKTNLVEAIGYVATLGSHRVATDAPLVRTGAQSAVVRATVDRDGRETLVELEIVPGRANRARLNRSPATRPRDVLGSLRTVLFAPEDLALVKGDPDGRRRFLDEVLVALAPRLAGVRADYERVLRQRNALLRTAGGARGRGRGPRAAAGGPAGGPEGAEEPSTLEVWDAHLATAGAELLFARLHLVRRIAPHVADAYQRVSGSDPATGSPAGLGYRCSVPEVDALDLTGDEPLPGRADLARVILAAIVEQRGAELERGTSLVGPHRDDLVLALDAMPARGYASHGESWSYALALRLGSYALLRGTPVQRTPLALPAPTADGDAPSTAPVLPGGPVVPGGPSGDGAPEERGAAAPPAPAPARGGDPEDEPVLILDDVFAELDAGRRTRLAALVADAEQVIVTAAVDDDVPEGLGGARLRVQRGEVRTDA